MASAADTSHGIDKTKALTSPVAAALIRVRQDIATISKKCTRKSAVQLTNLFAVFA